MSLNAMIAAKYQVSFRLIQIACQKLDIQTTNAEENIDIINQIKNHTPDIIFFDESFIKTEDETFLEQLRNIENISDAFIIFTSTNLESSKLARDIGADSFLPIPFSKMKLDSILRSILNKPKRILIVCAQENDIIDLTTILTDHGFEVCLAKTGDECMIVTHRVFPDLIISDYKLKDISGLEVCRRIKKANLACHIPLIILSHDDKAETIEMCFKAGAHDVLLKPFDQQENIKKITSVITPPKKGHTYKVLVIDDSLFIRNNISKMFKQIGFDVYTAENGLQGLEQAEKKRPDIITCDYDMPTMNGWEFCIEIKKRESIRDIPVVMVTARGTEVDKKKGKVIGVAAYLAKPFKTEELQNLINRVLINTRQKKEQKTLAKYVASDVLKNVSDVIDGVKNREPEEKYITILFSDICSFTPKCERLNPRAVVDLLNSYFDIMIKILQKHNAIVDKLIGDAIVARFDSGDNTKDALNAVKAACAMLNALDEFNEHTFEKVEIRIGINSGNVILGNIGCESFRLDYTMVGDNVNIGQRLESQASNCGCLISSSTYELVKEYIKVGQKAELSLKGKQSKVTAYSLLCVNGNAG